MRYIAFVILILLTVACGRDEIPLSGTVTIDSRLYESDQAFYTIGFTFSTASPTRNDRSPAPDLYLLAETDAGGNITVITFSGAGGFQYSPFAAIGDFSNATEADSVFRALREFEPDDFSWVQLARPLSENQVWLFRTRDEKYAKLSILEISTGIDNGNPFASCRFRWVYEPGGTTTFP